MKHILVPIDGSSHSLAAVDVAADIAEKFGAKLTLLHVVPIPTVPAGPDMPPATYITEFSAHLRKVGDGILKAAEQRLAGRRVEVQRNLVEGVVVSQIVAMADVLDVDLIVMGSRGLGPVRGFLLGSVSTRVLFQTSHSVLIVK